MSQKDQDTIEINAELLKELRQFNGRPAVASWMKNPTIIVGTLIGMGTVVMWGANAITRPERQDAAIKELVTKVDKMQATVSALERDFAVISDRVTRIYRERNPREATPNP